MVHQFFSRRFKLLRLAYTLSIKDFCDMLNIKSTGNITFWEQGSKLPSFTVLNNIVSFFGVSSDWLLGNSDVPYANDTLLKVEDSVLNYEYVLESGSVIRPLSNLQWIPKEYKNAELRQSNYSLEVRGNLVFLLNSVSAFYQAALWEYEMKNKGLIYEKVVECQRFYRILLNKPDFDKRIHNRETYLRYSRILLNAKLAAEPIYKIATNELQDTVSNELQTNPIPT